MQSEVVSLQVMPSDLCMDLINSLPLPTIICCMTLPFSAKFSMDKILQIGLLQIFMEINFQGSLLATPTRRPLALFVLTVAATPSSAARSQIQAFLLRGELRLRPSRFYSLEFINYMSQARDTCPLMNAVDVKVTKRHPGIWKHLLKQR